MCCRYFWDESMLSEVMYDYPDAVSRMPFAAADKESRPGARDVLPTEQAPVLRRAEDAAGIVIAPAFWGFPCEYQGRRQLAINARSETAASKRLFSQAMHEARCVVPASAFYEYTADKQKAKFTGERPILYLAGCMQQDRFVILTTAPDEIVAKVHDRMLLLLAKENVEEWISAKNVPSHLMGESTQKLSVSMPYQQLSLFDL